MKAKILVTDRLPVNQVPCGFRESDHRLIPEFNGGLKREATIPLRHPLPVPGWLWLPEGADEARSLYAINLSGERLPHRRWAAGRIAQSGNTFRYG